MKLPTKKRRKGLIVLFVLLGLFIIYNLIWILFIHIKIAPYINALPNQSYSTFELIKIITLDPDDVKTNDPDFSKYHDKERGLNYNVTLPDFLSFSYYLSIQYSPPEKELEMIEGMPLCSESYQIYCKAFRKPVYIFYSDYIQKILYNEGEPYVQGVETYSINVDKNGNQLDNTDETLNEVYSARKDTLNFLKQIVYDMWGEN